MSDPKQNISKFVKGMENKLYDKVKKASTETISQNALRDEKCTGIKRRASSGCCPRCLSLEGNYTKEEAKEKGAYSIHSHDGCTIMPEFEQSNLVLTREMIDDEKFGRKVGQHAFEFGLDAKKEEDREKFSAIILSIANSPDEVVEGTWRDKPQGVTFYIKGDNVVVMDNQDFITILQNGVNQNERVKSARAKR
jgi:hypothetical protein